MAQPARVHFRALLAAGTFLAAAAASAHGQFNDAWLEFAPEPQRLDLVAPLTSSSTHARFAWGDLNLNGWTDLVAVRRPSTFLEVDKRTNVLLMNESGVLVDRTAIYAAQAIGTPTADLGFLTATNDTDVTFVDVDGDGWLDVVTSVHLGSGEPKHISHPRVYLNLGEDSSGNWLGLQFDNTRFPQLIGADGLAHSPNFGAVAAGDVVGNGFPDLYFASYQESGSGGAHQPNPFYDRLMVNAGNGFFVDESSLRMTNQMLLSSFAYSASLVDLNGNGVLDMCKVTYTNPPQYLAIAYQNPNNPSFFNLFDNLSGPFLMTSVEVADLNRDGRLDLVVPGLMADFYRLNQGNDAFGRVIWGPWTAPEFWAFRLEGGLKV